LKLRKRVLSALIYPTAVICVAIIIITGIMIFVIPNFEKVFKDIGGAGGGNLPALTQFVLGVSRFVARNWFLIPLIPFALWGAYKLIRMNEGGALAFDKLTLMLPIFGGIAEKSNVARLARTLGTLIASGVPILEALDIIKAATANRVYAKVVLQIHENIRQGGAVAEPLANSGAFDDMVVNMVRVGEETGELDKMLLKIAESYDEEVDNLVQGFISLLEPLIIVVMGIAVGTIVIALFLPLITLMNQLSQKRGG
ncbi:MAG: type II secretion system F family protein, partial [Candidatus Brocadiia bacterium]